MGTHAPTTAACDEGHESAARLDHDRSRAGRRYCCYGHYHRAGIQPDRHAGGRPAAGLRAVQRPDDRPGRRLRSRPVLHGSRGYLDDRVAAALALPDLDAAVKRVVRLLLEHSGDGLTDDVLLVLGEPLPARDIAAV